MCGASNGIKQRTLERANDESEPMTETTEKLIRELADKLGTTTEHLWGVLVRQAIISGLTKLVIIVLWVSFMIWGYRLIIRKTKTPPKTESDQHPDAEWGSRDEGFIAWLIWSFLALWTLVFVCCEATDIMAALFNPEYWAIKQIIK